MIRIFATHDELLPTNDVPGMAIEYVYRLDHNRAVEDAQKKIIELEHQIAVLERVIARQDAMLVAKDEYEGG